MCKIPIQKNTKFQKHSKTPKSVGKRRPGGYNPRTRLNTKIKFVVVENQASVMSDFVCDSLPSETRFPIEHIT